MNKKRFFSSKNNNLIWVYNIEDLSLVNDNPFNTKTECATCLKISRSTVAKYLDSDKLLKDKLVFKSFSLNQEDLLKLQTKNKIPWEVITGELLGDASITIWGTNLGSTAGSRFPHKINDIIKLPVYYRSVFVGIVLSDGSLNFTNKSSKNALFRFSQTTAQGVYFWHVFFTLSHYCSAYPFYREHNRKGKTNDSLELYTRSLPCLTELYNLFYIKGVKVIPHNIYDLLTPVALAHLIMGDGSAVGGGVRIGTDSFSIKDCVSLMNVLMIKFNISCSLHSIENKPRIYIPKSSKNLLITLVKPHMVQSMWYKLGE